MSFSVYLINNVSITYDVYVLGVRRGEIFVLFFSLIMFIIRLTSINRFVHQPFSYIQLSERTNHVPKFTQIYISWLLYVRR